VKQNANDMNELTLLIEYLELYGLDQGNKRLIDINLRSGEKIIYAGWSDDRLIVTVYGVFVIGPAGDKIVFDCTGIQNYGNNQ
jgi:hypothetical protein